MHKMNVISVIVAFFGFGYKNFCHIFGCFGSYIIDGISLRTKTVRLAKLLIVSSLAILLVITSTLTLALNKPKANFWDFEQIIEIFADAQLKTEGGDEK